MRLKIINSGSSGNGYALISEAGEILLLECGVKGIEMKRAIDFQVGNVAGCLLSHSHRDHSGRIKDYLNSGIKVYTSDEVSSDILTVTGELRKKLWERNTGENIWRRFLSRMEKDYKRRKECLRSIHQKRIITKIRLPFSIMAQNCVLLLICRQM